MKSRRPPVLSHRRGIKACRDRRGVILLRGFLSFSYEMQRQAISHSYGVVGTS
jgi:hypothetical protein